MDLATASALTKGETQNVEKYENELKLLGEIPGSSKAAEGRVRWLMEKLKGAQEKIEQYERESGGLKKVLQSGF